MATVRVDAYRKKDGTRVAAHTRTLPDTPGPFGVGTASQPALAKSSIGDARAQGKAVEAALTGHPARARLRRAKLKVAGRLDSPSSSSGGTDARHPNEHQLEAFEVREGVRAREIKALDRAIGRGERGRKTPIMETTKQLQGEKARGGGVGRAARNELARRNALNRRKTGGIRKASR